MANKCTCYRKGERFEYDTVIMKGVMKSYYYCVGTKERDQCNCDGYMTQCDFYPEVRAKGRESIKIEDAINHFKYGITHDIFKEPVTSYAKLAVEALEKQLKG